MRVLKSFEYFEPRTIGEASQVLFMYDIKAKVLAGGVDLVPSMRRHEIQPECVVSLQRIPGLDTIVRDEAECLRIGALTSLRSVELSPIIKKDFVALYEAVHQIASIQVKTMGTAVGNLCIATPASDVATALFVLGARLRIASVEAERIIPIENFFIGLHQTILHPGEIVTEVLIPSSSTEAGSAFLKLVRMATDVSKVNVAVAVTVTNNACKEAKVALGSVAPTVIRARKAEEFLKGRRLEHKTIVEAAELAAEETKPITDIRSTAEYRKEITKVLVRRAIQKALDRASS